MQSAFETQLFWSVREYDHDFHTGFSDRGWYDDTQTLNYSSYTYQLLIHPFPIRHVYAGRDGFYDINDYLDDRRKERYRWNLAPWFTSDLFLTKHDSRDRNAIAAFGGGALLYMFPIGPGDTYMRGAATLTIAGASGTALYTLIHPRLILMSGRIEAGYLLELGGARMQFYASYDDIGNDFFQVSRPFSLGVRIATLDMIE